MSQIPPLPLTDLKDLPYTFQQWLLALSRHERTETGILKVIDTYTLNDQFGTIYITVSGKTITLPPANVLRIGQEWTVNLSVAGNVTIVTSGSDTLMTSVSAVDTSIQITTRGSSLTFICNSPTTWIMG